MQDASHHHMEAGQIDEHISVRMCFKLKLKSQGNSQGGVL